MIPPKLHCLLLPLLISAAALPAQNPLQWMPTDPLFVAQVKGPAAWQAAFGKTNLGRMLASPSMQQAMAPMLDMIEQGLREGSSETGLDLEGLYQQMLGYSGQISIGFKVWGTPDEGEPKMTLVLVATPDGTTDLSSFATAAAKLAEESGDDMAELSLDGKTFRYAVLDEEEGQGLLFPTMVGDHLVMVMSSQFEQTMLALTGQRPETAPAPKSDAIFSMTFRSEALKRLLSSVMESEMFDMFMGEDDRTMAMQVMDILGLKNLGDIDLALSAAGDHVVSETTIAFTGQERGLFELYQPAERGHVAHLDLVPRSANHFSASPVRLDLLYALVMRIVDVAQDQIGMSSDDIARMFSENFKVRLNEDLIAHLDGSMIMLAEDALAVPDADTDMDEDQDEMMDSIFNFCVGFGLKDSAAFGQGIETLVRSLALHTTRKSEDFQGTKIFKLPEFAGVQIEYAITDRLLLISATRSGAAALRKILVEERARKEGVPVGDFPAHITNRLKLAPKNHSAFSVSSLIASLKLIEEMGSMSGDPDLEGFMMFLKPMASGLKDFQLEDVVSVMVDEGRRLTFRAIW